MLLWMVLVVVASSVVASPTPKWLRRDAPLSISDALTSEMRRHRREIDSSPSNIFWIRNLPSHMKSSKIIGKEFNYDDKNRMFNKLYKIKTLRRHRRASPSTDAVKDDAGSQWLRKSALPKTNFITNREHRTEKSKETNEDVPQTSLKTNEVESPSFKPRMDLPIRVNRLPADDVRGYNQPTRRIIYYADLPEVTSRPHGNQVNQRRYEPVPLRTKYPRDHSHEEAFARSKPLTIDRYRDRPAAVNSYTIVDNGSPDRRGYPARLTSNYNELPNTKYNKIPAPYHRQNDFSSSRNNQQNYESYPLRSRDPASNPGASTVRDEPYRDYNPRQPAPWSVQIGTKLTVKDDGRPFRRDDGRPYRQDDGQRRFYVNSQEAPRYNSQTDDRTRYRLL